MGIFYTGAAVQADWKDDIGYTQLAAELGDALPTGQGISITQVEAGLYDTGYFQPDTTQFPDQTFNFRTATPSGVSSHATIVGSYLYGSSSIAPDAGTDGATINIWEANDWLNRSLNSLATENADVANFSWIGATGNVDTDAQITKKLDYSINRDDYLAVVCVDNGSGACMYLICFARVTTPFGGLSRAIIATDTRRTMERGCMRPAIVARPFIRVMRRRCWKCRSVIAQTAKNKPGY